MKTSQDYENESRRGNARLAEYERKLQAYYSLDITRARALTQVRAALEEAIAFTGRWTDMARLSPGAFQAVIKKRVSEVSRLNTYFINAKRRLEDMLAERQVSDEPERFVSDESSWDHAGEGALTGSAGKEHAGDSGAPTPVVDAGGSQKEQETK